MGRWQGGSRKETHSPWVRAAYIRWLEAGGPDVWKWLATQTVLGYKERARILAVRRSLTDAVSERELQP